MKIALTYLILIALCMSCTASHHTSSATSVGTSSAASVRTLSDSLSASWRLTKIDPSDDPNLAFLQSFIGQVISLNKSNTYSMTVQGRKDAGTWALGENRTITAVSSTMNSSASLQIVSLDDNNFVAQYVFKDTHVLFTFTKVQ